MIGLHLIKYYYNLSDKLVLDIVRKSSELMYFCGLKEKPIGKICNSSSLTKWRERVGEDDVKLLLKETIQIAKKEEILKDEDFETVISACYVSRKSYKVSCGQASLLHIS